LPEKERLIKQINKLMFGKIIEISIIIVLVGLSIPAWSAFAKIGDINVIKIEDCKLNFQEKRENETDFLTIENNYAINKNYKIYLETNMNVSLETIVLINNKKYTLNDFYRKEANNNRVFTLIDKNIVATTDAYNIKVKTSDKANTYHYIFEEINNF